MRDMQHLRAVMAADKDTQPLRLMAVAAVVDKHMAVVDKVTAAANISSLKQPGSAATVEVGRQSEQALPPFHLYDRT